MYSLLSGAREAGGTVIIIDVFRAFTTASVALAEGVSKIVFFADPGDALAYRNAGKADFCAGEVDGIPPPGYNFGNSPHELATAASRGIAIRGKVMAHSTRAGTVGVNAAVRADQVYGGSLANAKATIDAVRADQPDLVSIVAMGLAGKVRTDEDEMCAIYMRNLLEGRSTDHDAIRSIIRSGHEVRKFDDPAQPQWHREDVDFALDINSLNQVVRIEEEDGLLVAKPR